MAIGSAIALFVIGAILVYAVEFEIAGLDITTIGYILMAAGVIGGIIGAVLYASRDRRRTVRTAQQVQPTPDGGRIVETEVRR